MWFCSFRLDTNSLHSKLGGVRTSIVYVRLDECLILSGTLADFHANSTVSGLITTISGLSMGKRGGTEMNMDDKQCSIRIKLIYKTKS